MCKIPCNQTPWGRHAMRHTPPLPVYQLPIKSINRAMSWINTKHLSICLLPLPPSSPSRIKLNFCPCNGKHSHFSPHSTPRVATLYAGREASTKSLFSIPIIPHSTYSGKTRANNEKLQWHAKKSTKGHWDRARQDNAVLSSQTRRSLNSTCICRRLGIASFPRHSAICYPVPAHYDIFWFESKRHCFLVSVLGKKVSGDFHRSGRCSQGGEQRPKISPTYLHMQVLDSITYVHM
jgi:hypothetical protein